MIALSKMAECLERFKSGDMSAAEEFDRMLNATEEKIEEMKRTLESAKIFLASSERSLQVLLASDGEFTPVEDDGIPQDTSLPDDVVERVARLAVSDMNAAYQSDDGGPYIYLDDDMRSVGVDGLLDMHRLVRVVSAALKENGHG